MMVDTQTQATVLAGLAGVGAMAFVVGSALLATQYFGVWAGVTVGGLAVTIVAVAALFVVGTAVEQTREVRQGGRFR
jgi:hypothetical protein